MLEDVNKREFQCYVSKFSFGKDNPENTTCEPSCIQILGVSELVAVLTPGLLY